MAAVLRERQILVSVPARPSAPYISDFSLPRFGEFLLKNHFITETDLQSALKTQRELAERGQSQTLGQILLGMGVVTREELDIASIQQVRELQEALQEANARLEGRVAQRTQELERALDHLHEVNRLKTNFVSNISHELRTPLTHIEGYSKLLQDSLGPLNEEQHSALKVVLRAAERLGRLIEDLIAYASTAQGKMIIYPTAFSLSDLIETVLARPNIMIARTRIHLQTEIADDLPPTLADYEKVEWVVHHLLENAIKFTPEGGEVEVRATQSGERLLVSIRDTGIGIPAEKIDELFEPFHQLDGDSTRHYGGAGLGLALVKQFVEAHGSTVKVLSQPSLGSVFSFDLPIAMS